MTPKNCNIIRIALLFALLLLPIGYALFTASDLSYSLLKKGAYVAVVLICLLLPLSFLKARTFFIAEGILNFLFFPIDIASLYLNKQSASAPFLQSIFHTNVHEALELMISFWPLCVVTVLLWVVYFILAFRVQNQYLLGAHVRKILLGTATGMFVAGVLTMMVYLKRIHQERGIGSLFSDAVILVELKFYKIYPYNLYIHTTHLLQKHYRTHQLKQQVDSFSFGIQPKEDTHNELIILVIGEASRYDHWGLNGYMRNTTPFLSTCSNLISYDRVYTQANQTEHAVPLLLTRATAEDFERAYAEKSLPEAFQEAGYWSGYISKQVSFDITDRISQACDYALFYGKTMDVDGNYDGQMISSFQAHIRDTMQFFILHTLGSHFRYEHRYPDTFEFFRPTLGKSASHALITEEHKEPLINAYDNSIRYTDYFLHQLIQSVDSHKRPAVIMYISDHGESFWDDERKLSLHCSYALSEAEFHVPMIVWYSEAYAELYPDKIHYIYQNKTTSVASDVVFHSLLDIAGIEAITDSSRSICSPYLQSRDTIRVHSGSGSVESMPLH